MIKGALEEMFDTVSRDQSRLYDEMSAYNPKGETVVHLCAEVGNASAMSLFLDLFAGGRSWDGGEETVRMQS